MFFKQKAPRPDLAPMPPERLLELDNVGVHFPTRDGLVRAVNGVSYHVNRGEVLGIVGESGSGKSVTARSIMRLQPRNALNASGTIRFRRASGKEVLISSEDRQSRTMRSLRGGEIGMVFQEPMTALSPVHTIGTQIMRTVILHKKVSKAEARNQAIELLKRVQMPRPADIAGRYPHHLSGGMRQRAMIALALACDPALLIADEPTTALDVTTEAQILELLKQLQEELNMAIVFITHNFGVVADIADRVAVMYLGRVVETGTVDEIFYEPKHPYTQALLQSIPRLGKSHGRRLRTISGMVPDPYNVPGGCSFHPRCMHGVAGTCDVTVPEDAVFSSGQRARCHFAGTAGIAEAAE
ncbi:Glutathione import ATP-binding protein GsiA [Pannonibacter phragmitetus]|uniref:Glutathione import ATP-binding protein GsiA n=1 Tax=Pannonibacter phragmitetus TaxID=121719 RepID=A0A378ZZT1_9HYPH|nr:ABC transporter ATP-binding protein [Pannonibacter phragmitetus]SUB02735.1 Glutathione import ATP-binding protein GsiA [Pannonibacter phragmitetus]